MFKRDISKKKMGTEKNKEEEEPCQMMEIPVPHTRRLNYTTVKKLFILKKLTPTNPNKNLLE